MGYEHHKHDKELQLDTACRYRQYKKVGNLQYVVNLYQHIVFYRLEIDLIWSNME